MTFEEFLGRTRTWWENGTVDWKFLVILLVILIMGVALCLRWETVIARRAGREPAHCRFWKRAVATVIHMQSREPCCTVVSASRRSTITHRNPRCPHRGPRRIQTRTGPRWGP